MTVTEFGFCPRCEERKELVMNSGGMLQCHSCGNMNIYESKRAFESAQQDRE